MTPGRPSPPSAGEYLWALRLYRADTLSAARTPNQIRCESLRSRTGMSSITARRRFLRRARGLGEQPGRERPHLRTPDPDPRVGRGSLTSRLRD